MELWIARDFDNALYLYFNSKPFLMNGGERWNNQDCIFTDLPEDLFPEITFENSPQQVEINLIKD